MYKANENSKAPAKVLYIQHQELMSRPSKLLTTLINVLGPLPRECTFPRPVVSLLRMCLYIDGAGNHTGITL